jgi:two-component system sensor histidine kinase PilS (NtrC family)
MQETHTSPFAPWTKQQVNTPLATEDLWRSLYFFGLYRLILGGLLLLLAVLFSQVLALDSKDQVWVYRIFLIYIFLTLIALVGIKTRQPPFPLQLAFQVGTDIVVFSTLSYFSGGIQSNLGLLMLVSIAGAGLISRGRITLFYAALASIAILLEHAYAVLTQDASTAQFLQAGILSASFFAVAWLSHTLSRYAVASERLAFTRGVDLSNMAEANRLMIQDMPDGVLVVDEQGTLRQCNPSAERLLGLTLSMDNINVLANFSPLLDTMFSAWRQNKALGLEVIRLITTNRLVRVRFLPVQRQGFWGAVIVLEDMQRAQDHAQQVKLAALGRLTANIAHEVRNPLSSISYAAELLREGQADPAQMRLTQIILENAARLNRIVQDVMQLNRRDRANVEPIDLSIYLSDFSEELCRANRVPASTIEITAPSECVVSFDRGHLEQVLWNLGQNALRYCRNLTGSLKLNLTNSEEGGGITLDVIDDGPGVNTEAALKLFEPFFTTESAGTGLGLYIGRELCEANGAFLEYVPQTGGGACFRIVFGVTNGI